MTDKYVYVPSYSSLYYALYLMKKGFEVTIITNNKGIAEYCESNSWKFISFERTPLNLFSILNVFKLKKRVKKIAGEIPEESEVYFLFRSYDTDGFCLMRELAKKNRLFFINITAFLKSMYHKKGIRKYINPRSYFIVRSLFIWLLKIFADVDLTLEFIDMKWVPVFSEKFFTRHNIEKVESGERYDEIKLEVVEDFSIKQPECKTLILKDGRGMQNLIYVEDYNEIYRKLSLKLELDIRMKDHPPEGEGNAESISFEKYPTHLPSELLLKNVKSNVVSTMSMSLITAALTKNLNAISLLELVRWKDEDIKKNVKKWLNTQSKGRILFPKDYNELIELIT